ncbi:hypothetical protein BU23DRAFT_594777 [Bimuria novae-zelandiae CBS 107.79]|uniref:Uncharacterized protein n=1 Tax=Bimuria novae-zelandiae CBS 107.79 TaxID=1447943 RepID=A0A6A5VQL5_9PLEO|nr:hypothetical protein BU23DRAFT_594777 [Bimuria novae-zelandiae CBS 107.79]
MLKGHKPRCMEDKIRIETEAPEDGQANTVLHIYFDWTPREIIQLDIAAGDPNRTEAKDWATIVKISWKMDMIGEPPITEEKAKVRAIRLCNNVLDCAIEEEEDEDEDEDAEEDENEDDDEEDNDDNDEGSNEDEDEDKGRGK